MKKFIALSFVVVSLVATSIAYFLLVAQTIGQVAVAHGRFPGEICAAVMERHFSCGTFRLLWICAVSGTVVLGYLSHLYQKSRSMKNEMVNFGSPDRRTYFGIHKDSPEVEFHPRVACRVRRQQQQ